MCADLLGCGCWRMVVWARRSGLRFACTVLKVLCLFDALQGHVCGCCFRGCRLDALCLWSFGYGVVVLGWTFEVRLLDRRA